LAQLQLVDERGSEGLQCRTVVAFATGAGVDFGGGDVSRWEGGGSWRAGVEAVGCDGTVVDCGGDAGLPMTGPLDAGVCGVG